MVANQSVPGLNRGLSLNFSWQTSENNVKYSDEYVLCMENHVLVLQKKNRKRKK